jgi:hypothetical protein
VRGLRSAVAQWWRSLRDPPDGHGMLVARALLHPHPAWGDRADRTVPTLVLRPLAGSPALEEELPVRRVDAETDEICCVPFLQMRLALGDVVRIDSRGYVGEVVRASGRVSFAVRCTDPTAGAGVRGLTGDFAATVVEEIADHGVPAFAVAASAEEAGGIRARLEAWEAEGRLSYRSVLRTDGVDTPLV